LGVAGRFEAQSKLVLFVTDVLHPIHDLAVQTFLDCDMSHGCGGCCPMPVLFARRKPDHVSGAYFLSCAAFPLDPSTAGRDNQRLPEGMRMPGGTRRRFKGDAGAGNKRRVRCLKERVNAYSAGKPVCRTFARGLRTDAFDLHHYILLVS
jgi:hypothetical protein